MRNTKLYKLKNKLLKAVLCMSLLFITGCDILKKDSMEDINIVTTTYSVEYVTNYLYGENSVVNSIYPDDTNTDTYKFTDKQIKENSNQDLFVYMGKTKDSDIAIKYLNTNKDLKIIDATYGMEIQYGEEELWLNPSNLLMISENIKNGLNEYISSTYLINQIEEKNNELRQVLSSLDSEIKLSIENSKTKLIVVGNKSLGYLSKYGLDVLVVNKDDSDYEKNLTLLKNYVNNNIISNFYILENTKLDKEIEKLTENGLNIKTLRNLKNITDEERNNNTGYVELSKQNLESIKEEIY